MIVFRGIFEVINLDDPRIQQIVVSIEREGAARSAEEIRRNLPRAAFFHAVEREHLLSPVAESPAEKAALEAARVRTLQHPVPPDPELPLERYAAIAAELSEQKEPRAEVLARNELTEFDFTLEARCWSHRMAEARAAGDRTIASRYARLFAEAQDRLAHPAEAERTFADYTKIAAEAERRSLSVVLRERGISMAEWTRLERRMAAERRAYPELVTEQRRLLAESKSAPAVEG